eukprot:9499715-Pyramimonas_sp.AAC.1
MLGAALDCFYRFPVSGFSETLLRLYFGRQMLHTLSAGPRIGDTSCRWTHSTKSRPLCGRVLCGAGPFYSRVPLLSPLKTLAIVV